LREQKREEKSKGEKKGGDGREGSGGQERRGEKSKLTTIYVGSSFSASSIL
jgi:hypothetical protein